MLTSNRTNSELASSLRECSRETIGASFNDSFHRSAVKCPKGENVNDWIAVNALEFFNEAVCIYAPISSQAKSRKNEKVLLFNNFKDNYNYNFNNDKDINYNNKKSKSQNQKQIKQKRDIFQRFSQKLNFSNDKQNNNVIISNNKNDINNENNSDNLKINKNDNEYEFSFKNLCEQIERSLNYVNAIVCDTRYFPETENDRYANDFKTVMKNVFEELLRAFLAMYLGFRREITHDGLSASLNTCFRHFLAFANEFNLLQKEETENVAAVFIF